MYHLFIATPEKVVFDGEVKSLLAPGTVGYMEILTDHASIISTLRPGRMEVIDKEGKKWLWSISGGYLDVMHNEVSLLADTALQPDEIDLPRAEAALERAQKRLEDHDPEVDRERAKKAFARAENRIAVYKLKDST